jgi:hypothetical protein
MPTDLLSIIDTAVKIGLGALITGVSAYAVNAKNHRNEKEKYLLDRKVQTIEVCAEKIDQFFDAWLGILSKLGAITRRMEDSGKPLTGISKAAFKQIKERDAISVVAWPARNYAISRFRILGAETVVNELAKSSEPYKLLRERIIFENDIPSFDEHVELKKELDEIKKNVHDAIAKFYRQISV